MIKATSESITNAKPPNIELTPERIEYVGADEVMISLKTNTGDLVTYTMSSAALVQSVNLSVALINSSPARIFRDLGVF